MHNHSHSHGGEHHHHEHSRDSRALTIAMFSTGVIFVAQVFGGYYSNSLALLSDAGHMLTDFASLMISFMALRIAIRPKDSYSKRFSYGLRRVEVLAALVNGILLLGICGFILVESLKRFFSPEPVLTVPMLAVATVGLISNIVSAYFLHGSENLNTRSAYLHVMADLLSSVAVILGGVAMLMLPNAFWIDPLLSLGITVVIFRSAYRVTKEAGIVLMETVPAHLDFANVEAALKQLPQVHDVHDVHIWQIGSHEIAVSAHVVTVSPENPDSDLSSIRKTLKDRFAIGHSTIQLESQGFFDKEQCDDCPL